MALLNSLVTKGEWFARKYFVLIGHDCLRLSIKDSRKFQYFCVHEYLNARYLLIITKFCLVKTFVVSVFNNFGLLLRNLRFHYGNNKLMEIRKTSFSN